MLYLAILLLGITAGLRTATALAAVSIGAWLGWINLSGTWAAFFGSGIALVVFIILAVLEYIGDTLPRTPSRKAPMPFAGRVIAGALAGLLVTLPSGQWLAGLVIGAIGGVIGTLGGYEARRRLALAIGRDLPAALVEDAVAIILALLAIYWARGA